MKIWHFVQVAKSSVMTWQLIWFCIMKVSFVWLLHKTRVLCNPLRVWHIIIERKIYVSKTLDYFSYRHLNHHLPLLDSSAATSDRLRRPREVALATPAIWGGRAAHPRPWGGQRATPHPDPGVIVRSPQIWIWGGSPATPTRFGVACWPPQSWVLPCLSSKPAWNHRDLP